MPSRFQAELETAVAAAATASGTALRRAALRAEVAVGVLPRSGAHWLASLLVGNGERQAGANPTA